MRDRYGDRNWEDDRYAGWTQERGGEYERSGQPFDQVNRGYGPEFGTGYGEGGYYGQGRRDVGRGFGQGYEGRGRFGPQGYYGQGGYGQGRFGGQGSWQQAQGYGQGGWQQGQEDWDQGQYGPQAQYGGPGYGQGGWQHGQSYGQPGYGPAQFGRGGFEHGRYGQMGRWGQAQGPFRGAGPKGYARSDDRIREDVSDRLEDHDELDAHEIEVKVSEGIVSLSGTVPDRSMKRMAEDIAESCQGVRDVRNELRLEGHEHDEPMWRGSSKQAMAQSSTARQRSTATAGRP
jgi:hypothetical protein